MKTTIHPQYVKDAKVVCNCDNTFTTGSTKPNIHVEVCYKCHPLYTGEQRFMDIAGRVETFKKKQAFAASYKATSQGKRDKKGNKEEKKVKTLRELLGES